MQTSKLEDITAQIMKELDATVAQKAACNVEFTLLITNVLILTCGDNMQLEKLML